MIDHGWTNPFHPGTTVRVTTGTNKGIQGKVLACDDVYLRTHDPKLGSASVHLQDDERRIDACGLIPISELEVVQGHADEHNLNAR